MTIGEKIARLRVSLDISQEQLAEKLSVSRQSVSKWEMDSALPQIDKVLQLCDVFNISADELLRDKVNINRKISIPDGKNKYFGTDGFRGEANVNLTSVQAYRVGRFLGWYYSSELS
ncbi:MAG: helix-turn-helix domain-containing protein, partial [Clostridia bacterium]|nr:helix-turn-helix domain-containing protein [Clostridia bacterium]